MLSPETHDDAFSRTLRTALHKVAGVRLHGDVHERFAELNLPLPSGHKRRLRHDLIRKQRILFIHVPKNAGTSACMALYGQEMEHRSIRYFAKRHPDLLTLPSVAIVRDPVERFISAFRHARSGGGRHRTVADIFARQYAAFRSIDDALDHVEHAHGWYHVDHIFRPQSWYICDRKGRIAVKHIFSMSNMDALRQFLFPDQAHDLPTLNTATAPPATVTAAQKDRIRRLYAPDYGILQTCFQPTQSLQPTLLRGRAGAESQGQHPPLTAPAHHESWAAFSR